MCSQQNKNFGSPTTEERQIFRERHDRIKSERRDILKTIMGLSGSAIVLSVTLLRFIAPNAHQFWLLGCAWILLECAVLFSVYYLVEMTKRSVIYQLEVKDAFEGKLVTAEIKEPGHLLTTPIYSCLREELIAGSFFVLGTVCLGVFAVINLIADSTN